MTTKTTHHRRASVRSLLHEVGRGLSVTGTDQAAVVWEERGAPLIGILDGLEYYVSPASSSKTEGRRKKLGRRKGGHIPPGMDFEGE